MAIQLYLGYPVVCPPAWGGQNAGSEKRGDADSGDSVATVFGLIVTSEYMTSRCMTKTGARTVSKQVPTKEHDYSPANPIPEDILYEEGWIAGSFEVSAVS